MLTQLFTAQFLIQAGAILGVVALIGASAAVGYMFGRGGAQWK